MKDGQSRSKTMKILDAMPVEDILEFLDQTAYLKEMMVKYRLHQFCEEDPDELLASSIAYHLSRLVDKFWPMMKEIHPHRKYWMEINYEAWDEKKISGKGKTLC